MARKKIIEEVTEKVTTQEEEVTEEVTTQEVVTEEGTTQEEETPQPKNHLVTLDGRKGQNLSGSINGVLFSLPCGIEIEVSEAMYQAVKAHIIHERTA